MRGSWKAGRQAGTSSPHPERKPTLKRVYTTLEGPLHPFPLIGDKNLTG